MQIFHRRGAIGVGLGLVAASTAAGAAATSASTEAARRLTGTWRLARYENTRPDGRVETPYGTSPKGYFYYASTGHLGIHIMRTPPARPFVLAADEAGVDVENARGTEAEVRDAYAAYVGYFGTWRINPEATAVIHIVEGAARPSYIGTEQLRPFTLSGDTLIVRPPPWQDGTTTCRELHRVR